MSRGRPANVPRAEARDAGLRFYTAPEPCFCGDDQRYVTNARCVTCAIHAAQVRNSGLDPKAREARRVRDAIRYRRRRHDGR